MSSRLLNILITLVLPLYLNIFAITAVRCISERFVQENPKISSEEQYINYDRTYNILYTDADISEFFLSGYSGKFIYNECPLILSENQESILLLMDLPPPLFNS
jgi:hypothetical protein